MLIGFFGMHLYAQKSVSPIWSVNSTGESWDVVTDQAIDNEGNIYLTGNFTGTLGYDAESESLSGEQCIFIARFNADSELLWLKKIMSTGFVSAGAISVNHSNEIFICGNYSGEMSDKNLNLATKSSKSGYIFKLNSTGDITWAKNIDGSFRPTQMHLMADHAGGVYFAGTFHGKLSIGSERFNSNYFEDVVVAHFDKGGNINAFNTIHGADDENVFDLAINPAGEPLLTGSFARELEIGKNFITSNGMQDVFLIKLDENLQAINVKQYGGIYDDEGRALTVGKNGKLFLAGNFTGQVDFGKTIRLESEGTRDVFLIGLDEEMEGAWGAKFGSPGSDCVTGMALNSRGDLYLIGSFRGSITIDDRVIETPSFANDAFLAKFNAEGKFKFIENIGGEEHDFGKRICIDTDNEILISGNFSGQMNLMGKRVSNSHGEDLFISRLHDCDAAPGVQLPADTSLCGSDFLVTVSDTYEIYFWNGVKGSNEFLADTSGQIILEAIDKYGCNSFDTMNLVLSTPPEIGLPDTMMVPEGEVVTLEAPEGMQQYLWSDGSTLPFLEVNTATMQPGQAEVWVQVTDDYGCVSDDNVNLKVVSLKSLDDQVALNIKNDEQFNIIVYPNPATTLLGLKICYNKPLEKVSVRIISSQGQLVKQTDFYTDNDSFKKLINIHNLPSDDYIVIIKTKDGYKATKFIKLF